MALATKVLGYGGMLVAAAAIWGIGFSPFVNKSLDYVRNNSTVAPAEAQTGVGHVQAAADWSPLFVLLIGLVGLVAVAIYRSEGF